MSCSQNADVSFTPATRMKILRKKKPVGFIFTHRERECFPITALCRVLRVSCSGCNAWLSRVPCARKAEDQRLAVEITAVFMRSRKTYGSPRIYVDLASGGICVGRNRIARMMQIFGLCAREKRSFKRMTDSRTTQCIASNVLARSFTSAAPNRKWVTDVRAIRTSEGWMYLAAVIDLFSRRIVGHAMSESNDTSLALQALNNAKSARGRSDLYTDRLCALHMQPNNERKG